MDMQNTVCTEFLLRNMSREKKEVYGKYTISFKEVKTFL